ncbi:MAG: GNAT family N-acetyltransferase [Pseudomonadota bacterium]
MTGPTPGAVLISAGADRLRRIAPEDRDRLLSWRNQPRIREASLTQDEIAPETHAAWFARALTRTDGVWAVFERGARPLGHVNAAAVAAAGAPAWKWSFYIGEADAPPGAGTAMLRLMLRLAVAGPAQTLLAQTLRANARSERLHEKLGFARVGADELSTHWRRDVSAAASDMDGGETT